MTTTATVRSLDNYVGGTSTPATTGAAARAALPAWRAVSVTQRAQKLFALRESLVARREDLACSVTTEMDKTIGDARTEVARMIEMVEYACAVPTTMQGRVLEDVSRGVDCETVRQPVGVSGRPRPASACRRSAARRTTWS